MAIFTSNTTFTTPSRLTFSFSDFTGGLNNSVSESKLPNNESPDLLNVKFRKDGVLEKRNGLSEFYYHSEYYPIYGDVHNSWVLYPEPNVQTLLLHVGADFIYVRQNGTTVYIPWGQGGEIKDVSGVQFMKNFYFLDGSKHLRFLKIDELETDDSPNIYFMKNPPADFTPTPKPATKGKTVERELSPQRIEVWYEPCQFEMEDGYKGANKQLDYCTMLTVHNDRLYATGNPNDPNMVYISDILNPCYFPASLPLQLPPNGDAVTAMRTFGDALIIGRKNDVYGIYGNTNRPTTNQYSISKITTHTGIINNKSFDLVHNFMFYVGSDGHCYKLKSTVGSQNVLASEKISDKINLYNYPISKTLEQIELCHTGYDKYNGEWWVQLGDKSVIYNYNLRAWTLYNGTENVQLVDYKNKFLLLRDDAKLLQFDESVHYDVDFNYPTLKLPIPCYWTSKDIDFGAPSRVKQIRDTYIVSEVFDEKKCDIRVKYNIDYVSVENESRIESDIALWDKAIWDKSRFISSNIFRSLPIMVGRRGRTFKIWVGNGYKFKDYVLELPHQSNSEVGDLFFCNNKFYVRIPRDYETREYYKEVSEDELYQPLKLYEISGLYEFKGYR